MEKTAIDWNAIRKVARKEYNRLRSENTWHPSHDATTAMEFAAKQFDVGFGVEGFCDKTSGKHGITYINMGDTYDTTLLFYADSEQFRIGNWGDIVEAHPSWAF